MKKILILLAITVSVPSFAGVLTTEVQSDKNISMLSITNEWNGGLYIGASIYVNNWNKLLCKTGYIYAYDQYNQSGMFKIGYKLKY